MIKLSELNKCKQCKREPAWSFIKGIYCPGTRPKDGNGCKNFFISNSNKYIFDDDHKTSTEEKRKLVHENHIMYDKIVADAWNKENQNAS